MFLYSNQVINKHNYLVLSKSLVDVQYYVFYIFYKTRYLYSLQYQCRIFNFSGFHKFSGPPESFSFCLVLL